jgi:CheY-like chemotaxis protein
MKTVLGVMSDLFFSVKINDAAKQLGMTAMFVKDKAVALERFKSKPALVIFDLNCASADPLDLIRTAKEAAIPTVGFISHVQVDLKRQAQEAGCDTVVARSVFAQQVLELIEQTSRQPDREAS